MTFPNWLVKLAARLCALKDGEYIIMLHKDDKSPTWQVVRLDDVKLERP